MTAHGLERDDYEALVIGSGFGGAVTACRLAQAGIDVAIVERGRRYPAGSFPRDLTKLDAGWLWSRGQGTDAPPSDHRKSTPMKERRTMTTPTDIDRDAPVIADHEIDITAPLDRVWSLHTRVNAWPSWNQEMTGASLEGPFEAGNSFTWTSYGFTVTSTIYEVDDHSRTLWGGEAQGITGTHEWRFESTAEGVHVTTTESFAGDPVVADTAGMQTLLDNSLVTWLGRLKTEAERH